MATVCNCHNLPFPDCPNIGRPSGQRDGAEPQGARQRAEALSKEREIHIDAIRQAQNSVFELAKNVAQLERENSGLRNQVEQLCGDLKACQIDYGNANQECGRLREALQNVRNSRNVRSARGIAFAALRAEKGTGKK